MTISIPFLAAQNGGAFGLSNAESSALTEEAFRLIMRGDARGVGEYLQDDIIYSFVLDHRNESYTIGRHAGVYFLLEPDFSILALDRQFDNVIKALRTALASRGNSAAARHEIRRT